MGTDASGTAGEVLDESLNVAAGAGYIRPLLVQRAGRSPMTPGDLLRFLARLVRDADRKSVSQIGAQTRELAGKARNGRLSAQEMSGGTFSVSNLGMFGIGSFSAVINPPEAAILAVGAVRDEPVIRDGQVVPGKRMTVTLSVDHRACDGATAAKFLARLAELLQNPVLIVA